MLLGFGVDPLFFFLMDNDVPSRIFLVFHGRLPLLRRGRLGFESQTCYFPLESLEESSTSKLFPHLRNGEPGLCFYFYIFKFNHWLSSRMMLSNRDSTASKTKQRFAFVKLSRGTQGVQH